jgi:uncharacterized protein (TIGR02452 family)
MNKNNRILIAQKTLEIIENGFYHFNENKINIKTYLEQSIQNTFTIAPDQWENLLISLAKREQKTYKTKIFSKNCTSIEALLQEETSSKIAILNFASAKNPGGGFLGGAVAQEESLARSSSLYATLTKDMKMYLHNRAQSSFLYSEYMIYSPNVLFWLNDEGDFFKKPLMADVITSPAPNKGAMLQNNRTSEMTQIETVLYTRMEKVLAIAQLQQVEILILGAWGCGVFRNEPKTVAVLFKQIIQEKYPNAFKRIVFAVYDTSEKRQNFKAFETLLQP